MKRSTIPARMLLASTAFSAAAIAASPAWGVIIAGGSGNDAPLNNTPPTNDPGWDRVGRIGNGTGVYLGNGFVLTAQHVSSKTSITINGQTFNQLTGTSGVTLKNNTNSQEFPDLTSTTDLHLFRVAVPQGSILHGLDPLGITTTSLRDTGQLGTWIGTGRTQVQQTVQNYGGGNFGYDIGDGTSRDKRWAQVEAGQTVVFDPLGPDVVGFFSVFENVLNDGRAASNDSGSPFFWAGLPNTEFDYDQPVLAGIALVVGEQTEHSNDQAWFTDVTGFADMFEYRDQVLTYNGDLSGDQTVDADDLALVLNSFGRSVQAGNYLLGDGTGDGFVGAQDLRLVLNNWSEGPAPSIEQAFAIIPEPGTAALLAMSGLLFARRRR